MNGSLTALAVLLTGFLIAACEKTTSSDARIEEAQLCFQGKFIQSGCDGAEMLQVIQPLLDSLKTSTYFLATEDKSLEYVFATDIPEEYKDGQVFYFRVKGNFRIYPRTQVCIWPRYAAEVTGLSKDTCAQATTD